MIETIKTYDHRKKLDVIHAEVVSNVWAQFFTAFTRVLLAIGFIPLSIKKILNLPFTVLPDSHPVGNYFNALYQTGFYYQFIGWGQLFAALLLLFPRTAHLGALAFFPIILNIAILTISVDFVGTKYITLLMLLASAYLLAWDYDRLKVLFFLQGQTSTDAADCRIFLVARIVRSRRRHAGCNVRRRQQPSLISGIFIRTCGGRFFVRFRLRRASPLYENRASEKFN